MSDLFWLTDAQMARLEPFFPKSHGKPRVDDRRVLSGIIFINRNGFKVAGCPCCVWSAQDAVQSLEALERQRHLCKDDDGTGSRSWRGEDRDDRRDVSQGSPDSDQHGRQKGGRGRLIGRTKRRHEHENCTPFATARGVRSTCSSPPGRSATTSGHGRCLAAYPMLIGSSGIAAMMPTGSEKR